MEQQIEQQEVITEQPAPQEPQAEPQPEQPASEQPPQPEQPAAASDDGEHKQSRLERRFAKLTSERYALQAKVEAYERMLGQQQQQNAPQYETNARPQREAFQDDDSYHEALTDWKVDQKLSQREQVQTRQQAVNRFVAQQQSVAAEYPDWEDVIDEAQQLPASQAVEEAVLYSEIGPHLQYHLAKNPQEVMRLNALPPILAAREIGIIEARISAEIQAKKAAPKPQPVPKAPPPIAPVGSRGDVEIDPSKMSDADFAKWRRQQIAQRYKH